ncbi:MAG: Rieske 2Fe-2S domain-containing protein [Planctomycetes bacterium]|nr:Rieske 2Fe-2S domain-containing protein [Planctomycetota bacterium]
MSPEWPNDPSDCRWTIDPDIRRAWTPPASFYRSKSEFERTIDTVFTRSWQPIDLPADPRSSSSLTDHAFPFTLLPGCLDEPLVLVHDADGTARCLSNVCTHRGHLVVQESGSVRSLRCRYHGRRFELDGTLRSMPGFDGVVGFPSRCDDLAPLESPSWGPLRFVVASTPVVDFTSWIAPVDARIASLPVDRLRPDPRSSRTYEIDAHWALYVDNYLEGFHIPFVHEALADAVDLANYPTELFEWGSLQIGVARDAAGALDLPAGHPDRGTRVAAYWFWLYPNVMLNFYPWGLSVNHVQPIGHERTRIVYRAYVWDESRREHGAGADLDRVEREDDEVVESVSAGLRSRIYSRGRYSPQHERATHHFHRLLAASLHPT